MKRKVTWEINRLTLSQRQLVSAGSSHRIGSSLRHVFVTGTKYTAIGAIFCFIGVNIAFGEQPQKVVLLHHFSKPCDSCHVRESSDSANEGEVPNGVGKVKEDINRLCTSAGCHSYDAVLDHPVDVRRKGKIPTNTPLHSRTRITCLTCHEVPASSDSPDRADLGLERSLQRPSGIEFCAKCHTKIGGTLLEQSHWRSSARAHLGSMKPQSVRSQTVTQRIGGIDAESRSCLSCHDNISVTIPLPDETIRQKRDRWKTMSDHPIGMDYQYTALRKNRRYNSLLTDQQIRLFDGRLGCGSCHSPYSQLKDNLVMPNIRGALCRRCHNM